MKALSNTAILTFWGLSRILTGTEPGGFAPSDIGSLHDTRTLTTSHGTVCILLETPHLRLK